MNSVPKELEIGFNEILEHQRVIAELITGGRTFYNQNKIQLEPLPQMELDPGNSDSKYLDFLFHDNQQFTTPIIIEVSSNFGYKTDFIKVRKLVDETAYGIEEAFVYNYETKNWYKYSKTQGIAEANRSFSDVLQLDLNTFLRLKK